MIKVLVLMRIYCGTVVELAVILVKLHNFSRPGSGTHFEKKSATVNAVTCVNNRPNGMGAYPE